MLRSVPPPVAAIAQSFDWGGGYTIVKGPDGDFGVSELEDV